MTAVELDRPVRRRTLRRRRTAEDEARWTLARIFAVAASVAAVVALAAIVAGAVALWRLSGAAAALADVASPALITAQRLSVAVVDQETGVRGFASTGRDEFLQPYRAGLDGERAAVAELRTLSASGLAVEADLDAIEAASRDWRTGYAEPVLAGVSPAPAPEQGKALFDRVRAELDALVGDLEARRAEAASRYDAAASFLLGVGITIAAVLAGFLVAAAVGLRRGVLVPLSALAAQVREVLSGDARQPVRAGGPGEIVELGKDVEAMREYILADLVDAQATNRRLDEQATELERSNRDLEQFAYVASHDLQEPLRKVSSFCQLLQRRYGGQLDERADQYIEFAVDGAQRMQQLINDLLAFSRVGRTTDEFTPVDLGGAATAAAAALEAVREQAGGTIEIGPLPVVPGDRALLHQLFTNLLGNGLKFHREGVPPVVRVAAHRSGDEWEVTVSDNGIGIEPEYAEKVFVIFQRLHGREVYPGTGIGLALAKKIVEFHGGRIGLDPAAGPGATIRLTLPASEESSP